MENPTNENRDFMSTSFGDEKLNKETELNESMSIQANGADELSQKLNTLGGTN